MGLDDEFDLEELLLIGAGVLIGVQLFRFLQSGGGFNFQGSPPGSPSNLLAAIPMQVSPAGRAFIQSNEGYRSKPYKDASGNETVYWGHKITANDPPIAGTLAQAQQFFQSDIETVEATINGYVTVALSQDQFDALADLVFNIGGRNFEGSTLLQQLNAGNYSAAASEILKWNKSGGKTLTDLTERRQADAAKFSSGSPSS